MQVRLIFITSLALILFGLSNCSEETSKITPLTHSWEKAIPHQEIPEGLTSLSAKQCGACHQDHYEEWQHSTHSHAWTDLQFQAELKKETSPIMCINCHIPLQNQQEYIVSGWVDGDIYQPVKTLNPHFDKALQQEGINCASCHVRNNAIVGPTGTDKAPHKTVKDPDFLNETLCISCHNASAVITPTLACSFETGDEWKAGPYYGQKNCIDCHMDTLSRPVVPGYPARMSHRHYFSGSGIPKVDTAKTTMLNGLSITAQPPAKQYKVNDSLKFSLILKNEFAGHRVPTGDPERFFTINLALIQSNGDTLAHQSGRIGEVWEWYPEAKKISDNNLNPNESRSFTLTHQFQTTEQISLHVLVKKHRLNQHSADYNKLGSSYPLNINIYEKKYQIRVH